MKTCKVILISFFCLFSLNTAQAQILKKVKKAAEETAEDEAEKQTKKETKGVLNGIFGKKKKEEDKESSADNSSKSFKSDENVSLDNEKAQSIISGSQFFPNGEILFFERFKRDKKGDFPVNWLTDVGGEIIMVDNKKALYIYDDAQAILDIDPLPENCVIEFDLITQNLHGIGDDLYVQLISEKTFNRSSSGGSVQLLMSNNKGHNRNVGVENWGDKVIKIDNDPALSFWEYLERSTHVTIVKNKNRFRFYLDNLKVLDMPSFLGHNAANYLRFKRDNLQADKVDEIIAISNVKITEEAKDIRSQLLKGNLSTNKILFETGAAQIQTESESILKQIGEVLENNDDLQYLVIGHTDNVGSKDDNRQLSKQRAQAVIDHITENFNISKARLIAVGKGESEPVASNNTEDGKQKNRRVQFKKL